MGRDMPPETAQSADPTNKKTRARETESWATLQRFLPYLWPRDNPGLRMRIVVAMALVLAAKAVTLALPFAYKGAVDAMSGTASDAANVALALVAAYALGRFTSVAFDNLRNIAFERVGQMPRRKAWPRTCSTACTACPCASTFPGAPARSPRSSSAAPRASTRCSTSCCSTSPHDHRADRGGA
jgi:hypothetical protein